MRSHSLKCVVLAAVVSVGAPVSLAAWGTEHTKCHGYCTYYQAQFSRKRNSHAVLGSHGEHAEGTIGICSRA